MDPYVAATRLLWMTGGGDEQRNRSYSLVLLSTPYYLSQEG